MGSLYKRGDTWWVAYYHKGKQLRESAKTKKKTVAVEFLKKREGEVASNKTPGYYFDRVTFDDLKVDLLTDYRVNGRKNAEKAAQRIEKHLVPFFGGDRVPELTTARVKAYIEQRMEEGAANGTINRELTLLKRMLSLGAKHTPPKVDRVPHIPLLAENHARQGFFEPAQFEALVIALPDYLKGPALFAYRTGWRLDEVLGLTWERVDRKEGVIRLEAGETKNDEARNLYLDPALRKLLEERFAARRVRGNKGAPESVTSFVFHREGKRIKNYYPAWRTACERAKIPGRLFHDFRRTAVRNMVRAGIPERVAMTVSGHKTRSVFERYNIVSGEDLKAAAEKQAVYLDAQHDKHSFKHNEEERDTAEVVPLSRKLSK